MFGELLFDSIAGIIGYMWAVIRFGKNHRSVVKEKYDNCYADVAREKLRIGASILWMILLVLFIAVCFYALI